MQSNQSPRPFSWTSAYYLLVLLLLACELTFGAAPDEPFAASSSPRSILLDHLPTSSSISRMSSRLSTLPASDADSFNHSQIAKQANANDLSIEGDVRYSYQGTSLQMYIQKLINNSRTRTTGTIEIDLWATTSPYSGGTISGHILGVYRIQNGLAPGYYYPDFTMNTTFRPPNSGSYYITMTASDWNGSQYLIRDYVAFSDKLVYGSPSAGSDPQFSGTVSYNTSGDRVLLSAQSVTNRSNATTGPLRLGLWMTASRYAGQDRITGFQTATYQFPAPLNPNASYNNVSQSVPFTRPPAGTYWVTLALEEFISGEWLIADYRTFENQATYDAPIELGLRLIPPSSWSLNGTTLTLRAARVENQSSSRTTGTLRLEFWATTIRYSGGTLNGFLTGVSTLTDGLGPNRSISDIVRTAAFTRPPNNTYFTTLALTEWNGAAYTIRDYINMEGSTTFGATNPPSTQAKATITAPTPGSDINTECLDLRWSPGSAAVGFHLEAGTSADRNNLFDRGVGTATAQVVCGLPRNNTTIYVRLWTFFGGDDWQVNSYTYRSVASNTITPPPAGNGRAQLTNFSDGQTLPSACTTFRWNQSTGARDFYIEFGTRPDRNDIFDNSVGLVNSKQICGIPTSSEGLYMRLWTWFGGDDWQASIYRFTPPSNTANPNPAPNPNPEPSASGLQAQPATFNACSVQATNLNWNFDRAEEFQIRIGSPVNGAPMTGWIASASGSVPTGAWVSHGMQFFAVNRAGRTLGQTTVRVLCNQEHTMIATPNPITACAQGGVGGATKLSWDARPGRSYTVRLLSPTGTLVTQRAQVSELMLGPWVSNGMQVYLMDEANNTLATTTIGLNCR